MRGFARLVMSRTIVKLRCEWHTVGLGQSPTRISSKCISIMTRVTRHHTSAHHVSAKDLEERLGICDIYLHFGGAENAGSPIQPAQLAEPARSTFRMGKILLAVKCTFK